MNRILILITLIVPYLLIAQHSPRTAAAAGPVYAITNLGTFQASSINDSGTVAGSTTCFAPCGQTIDPSRQAAIWTSGGGVQALEVPPPPFGLPGTAFSMATGINNAGTVTGYVRTNNGVHQENEAALVWTSSLAVTNLAIPPQATPGTGSGRAYGINDANLMAASGKTVFYGTNAYSLSAAPSTIPKWGMVPHTWSQLTPLVGLDSQAFGINNAGQEVGDSPPGLGSPRNAVLWTNGVPRDLGSLPGGDVGGPMLAYVQSTYAAPANASSIAIGINDSGQVVGTSYTNVPSSSCSTDVTHAFLWTSPGPMQDLGSLSCAPAEPSAAYAINASGQIVGQSFDGAGTPRAVSWPSGSTTPTDLNTLIGSGSGWVLQNAVGINANGQIVGTGLDPQGNPAGFLLTPGPAGPVDTNTTVTSSLNPSHYGQEVTFTAVVAPAAGVGTPTGTVSFSDGATALGTADIDVMGAASISSSALSPGDHTITAVYSGDVGNATSTGTLAQTVTPAALTVTADDLSMSYGGSLPSFTAHYAGFVNGDSPDTLTGILSCTSDATAGSPAGTYAIDCSRSSLSSPNYSITYVPGTLTILQASQSINFGSLHHRTYGAAPFTVSATASSGLPVSFTASGTCTVTARMVTITGAGRCTVIASQDGDSNYTTAPSVTRSFNIFRAASTTNLVSSTNPSRFGRSVMFIATVTSPAGTPASGTITLERGNTVVGTTTLTSTGVARLTISNLRRGSHRITATFAGDSNVGGSTSPILIQIVI